MDFDEARRAFFSDFHDSKRDIAVCVEALSAESAQHIYRAYLHVEFAGNILQNLADASSVALKGAGTAKERLLLHEAAAYRSWQERINGLIVKVGGVCSAARLEKEVFGNQRMERYHLHEKVPLDSTILAIDTTVRAMYQRGRISGKRRELYKGAGLLYYLFDYEFFDLAGGAFPEQLSNYDYCYRSYRGRLRQAKEYLSLRAVKQRTNRLKEKMTSRVDLAELLNHM